MEDYQKEDERNTRENNNNSEELKAAIKASWPYLTPQQAGWSPFMPRSTGAVIQAKRVPTKYWVHTETSDCLTYLF